MSEIEINIKRQRKEEAKEMPMAVVLAGGKGMRLRPLTEDLPKPLLPLAGKPILEYILENLENEGVNKILILTGYEGEKIEKAMANRKGSAEIRYLREELSMGSAGCVKNAENFLESRFFVVCGDAFGYRNYRNFYKSHRENGGRASILTTRVKDPGEYGLVLCSGEGKVTGFREKPFWSQVFSDLANTGIYLLEKNTLEMIPRGRFYDFGADFFPALLQNKVPVYSYEDEGIWRDVGDHASYLACNLALNDGKSVIGKGAVISPDAAIDSSLLFENVRVDSGSSICSAIIERDCRIGKNCSIPAGCVIGKECVLKDGVTLSRHTVIKSGSVLEKSGKREDTVPDLKEYLCGDTLLLPPRFPTGFFRLLGAAVVLSVKENGSIGVMTDGSKSAVSAASALLCGICECGKGADLGRGFYAMASSVIKSMELDFGVFLYEQKTGGLSVVFLDENGLPPGGAVLRRLRDGMKKTVPVSAYAVKELSAEAEKVYERSLLSLLPFSLAGMTVGIGWGNLPSTMLGRVLLHRGAAICPEGQGEINVFLSPDGRRAAMRDRTETLDFWHIAALALGRDIRRGEKKIGLPYRTPEALFALAAKMGCHLEGYALFPEGEGNEEPRRRGSEKRYMFDGLAAALICFSMLRERNCRLKELAELLPPFSVYEGGYDCAEDEKLSILLRSGFFPDGEGMKKEEKEGRIRIVAGERRGVYLMAEAAKDFDAAELYKKAGAELKAFRKNQKKD